MEHRYLCHGSNVDSLLVSLAAEGFPNSGMIDYSFFAENAGFGTTDNEFNMIKLASMQTELANLIKGIEGVKDAKVMVTLPTESVFLNETYATGKCINYVENRCGTPIH